MGFLELSVVARSVTMRIINKQWVFWNFAVAQSAGTPAPLHAELKNKKHCAHATKNIIYSSTERWISLRTKHYIH